MRLVRGIIIHRYNMKHIKRFEKLLAKIETAAIIIILSIMVILAFGQVVLRNFFDYGIIWADIFLRQIVLWVGLIGASLAVREKKHIAIDVLPMVLPKSWKTPIRIFTDLSAGIISAFLTYAAWTFVRFEMEAESVLFNDIPVWLFQTILPFSFWLISIRFLLAALEGSLSHWKPER